MAVGEPCATCRIDPPAFDAACAAFLYRFPVDRLVTRFKFAGDLAAGRWLALRLADRVRDEAAPDLLVAAPLTARRLRERGFNQALEIAKVVGREIRVRVELRGVVKRRDTTPQPGLRGAERRRNLHAAFAGTRPLAGLHVALVDDVMTTGATAQAIALALKEVGARRVSVWVAARTPDPRR